MVILILAIGAAVLATAALATLAWGLSERRRANAADARGLEAFQRAALAEARMLQSEELSSRAKEQANVVAEELIKRTDETFQIRERIVHERIAAQLQPISESLAKFEVQVTAVEKTRAEETGGLKEQILQVLKAANDTQNEARKLSTALRRGAGVQGRWGEQALRNVLEMAGLTDRFDFEEQGNVDTEEGRRRPDVKVRLPGGGVFVIDAKCSLNAFLEAQDATSEESRNEAMARHASSLKSHMNGLSAKAYWDQFAGDRSPDFVAMFVPGDGFLVAALEKNPNLIAEGMNQRVLLVTPTSLFALCKAVAYGWRVELQERNTTEILQTGRELHKRLAAMARHIHGMGRMLGATVGKYNDFIGSLESQVLTQARRFEELGIGRPDKPVPELHPIGALVRELVKLAEGTADNTAHTEA